MISILVLIPLTILGTSAETPYIQTGLSNSGMLFEDVGNTLLYTDQWNIFTTISLKRVTMWKDYLQWSDDVINKFCSSDRIIEVNQTCTNNINILSYIKERINIMLQAIDKDTRPRNRRSIFDGVGKLSKFLFGTMDQDDANNVYTRLQDLENNDKQNFELIKEQVSLIKSNYESNNQILDEFNSNLNDFKDQVSNLTKSFSSSVNIVMSRTSALETKLTLDETVANIVVHLEEIEHEVNTLYIILNSLSTKHLHPLILSYEQIGSAISNLHISYPLHEALQDPFMIQQISRVESTQEHDTIFCKISIPLIQREKYSLKKIYPLPIAMEGITVHYEISFDYLITNDGASKFIPVHESDLKNCQKMPLNLTHSALICSLLVPIYTSPENNCLLLLYKSWPEANKVCKTVPLLKNYNTIIKMATENSWLYFCHNEKMVNIECREFQTTIKLTDKGILKVNPGCLVKIDNILLTSSNKFIQDIKVRQIDIIPKIEIPLLANSTLLLHNDEITSKLELIDHKNQKKYFNEKKHDLEKLTQKLEKIQKERDTQLTRNPAQVTHTIALAILGCTVFVLLLIVIIKACRKGSFRNPPRIDNKRSFANNAKKPIYVIKSDPEENQLKNQPSCSTMKSEKQESQSKRASIPLTTPTLKLIIPEERNKNLTVTDFEIV